MPNKSNLQLRHETRSGCQLPSSEDAIITQLFYLLSEASRRNRSANYEGRHVIALDMEGSSLSVLSATVSSVCNIRGSILPIAFWYTASVANPEINSGGELEGAAKLFPQ